MNILIGSAYSKSETDDCLTQYLASLHDHQYLGQTYAPIGNYDIAGTVAVYDSHASDIVIDEVVLFSPDELSDAIYQRYSHYDIVGISAIKPQNWEPTNVALRKNIRNNQLYNYYYAPKNAVFQCDPISITLIAGRALKLTRMQIANNTMPDVRWRTTDNQFCIFTGAEFIDFAEECDAYVEQVYAQSWQEMNPSNP